MSTRPRGLPTSTTRPLQGGRPQRVVDDGRMAGGFDDDVGALAVGSVVDGCDGVLALGVHDMCRAVPLGNGQPVIPEVNGDEGAGAIGEGELSGELPDEAPGRTPPRRARRA